MKPTNILLAGATFALTSPMALSQVNFTQEATFVAQVRKAYTVGNLSQLPPESFHDDLMRTFGGGACGDFNNDGLQDLVLPGGIRLNDSLFWNMGNGMFDEASGWITDAPAFDRHIAGGVSVGDFDNDGFLDIFMSSLGSSVIAPAFGAHRLLHNNGDGTFTDVADTAGVAVSSTVCPDASGSAWGDYDLDGDLDLFVAGWIIRPLPSFGNRLFRNEGNGTFTDVTAAAGVLDGRMAGFTPNFVDINGDRYPELLVAADFGTSHYFINNTDGTFTDFTLNSGTGLDTNGMGAAVADLTDDLVLDWMVTSVYNVNTFQDGNKLYEGLNNNHFFSDESVNLGLDNGFWGWGIILEDFDIDGDIDIAEVNGWNNQPAFASDRSLYWTNDSGTFVEEGAVVGFDRISDGRGLISWDMENDGDLDLVSLGNNERTVLYRNDLEANGRHWLRLTFDTSGNVNLAPNGIGTRVYSTFGTRTVLRQLDSCTNHGSQSELAVHIGMGVSPIVEELRIEWADGQVTVMEDVAVDQNMTIVAPAANSK